MHKVLYVILILNVCHGARILGVFPTPSISHQIVFRALMEELAKRGHHLVVMTADPVKYTEPEFENLTQIDVHDISYKMWTDFFNFAQQRLEEPDSLTIVRTFYTAMLGISDAQLGLPEMQELLHNPKEKFDLCFIESIVPVMFAFKDRFNCPLILISSMPGLIQNFDAIGNPSHPLMYADLLSPYDVRHLNFWQKVELTRQYIRYRYLYYWVYLPMYNDLAKKHFGPNVRPLDVIENNADMMFLNFHPTLAGVRPLVPGIVHMGSMHIKRPKPLPSDLQKILDNSNQGVVYFSLGSNVLSVQLPAAIRKVFLDAFRKIPYTVLWKWEDDSLPDQPTNVIISKWFPQQDIIGHRNVKAFITQGGQQSLEEAIHYGVPLIGIPFMADQALNVAKMVSFGIGKGLSIDTITVDTLRDAITDLIENKSFKSNITKLRQLMYDQPQTSLERTVWWTEYVLRHGGARHLRSLAADTPDYQYYMLDILAVLLVGAAAVFLAILLVARYLLSYYKVVTARSKLKQS